MKKSPVYVKHIQLLVYKIYKSTLSIRYSKLYCETRKEEVEKRTKYST